MPKTTVIGTLYNNALLAFLPQSLCCGNLSEISHKIYLVATLILIPKNCLCIVFVFFCYGQAFLDSNRLATTSSKGGDHFVVVDCDAATFTFFSHIFVIM